MATIPKSSIQLVSVSKLDNEASQYPNRGGCLGIQTSLDKICTDSKSLKGGLGSRTIRIPRPLCKQPWLYGSNSNSSNSNWFSQLHARNRDSKDRLTNEKFTYKKLSVNLNICSRKRSFLNHVYEKLQRKDRL